jgi:hypothetical protein
MTHFIILFGLNHPSHVLISYGVMRNKKVVIVGYIKPIVNANPYTLLGFSPNQLSLTLTLPTTNSFIYTALFLSTVCVQKLKKNLRPTNVSGGEDETDGKWLPFRPMLP